MKRDGKGVMECVSETARRAASWESVTQSETCGASRNSRHGMRNRKRQQSQNVALSECHGKVVMDSVMRSNTCATSRKGVTEINICLASPKKSHRKHQETVRRVVSWKDVMESDTVERHGKAVTECVTESMTQAASRKKRYGKRRGRCDVMINAASPIYRHPHSVTHTVTHSVTHTPSPT